MATAPATIDQATALTADRPSGMQRLRSCRAWSATTASDIRDLATPEMRASLPAARTEAEEALAPATGDRRVVVLTAIAARLGVRKDAGEYRDWLQANRQALVAVPDDLLTRAGNAAMEGARFLSEVVPMMMDAVRAPLALRRGALSQVGRIEAALSRPAYPWEPQPQPAAEDPHCPVKQAEIDAYIGKVATRDGPRPAPRMPTPTDYAEMLAA